MSAIAERSLLLGLLALQLSFVTREQLLESLALWTRDKSQPLIDQLTRQGKLTGDTEQLLRALTDQYIRVHCGDLRQSLAALSSTGSVLRDDLAKLGDDELASALLLVGVRSDSLEGTTLAFVDTALSTSNRFRILRPHARGGLGEVYVARDEQLQREVALKQIQEPSADDPVNRARFIREARITGGLEHPGIVPVYGLGHYDNGRPYYAMRFIRGDSLQEAIDRFHTDQPQRTAGQRSLELRKLLGRFVDVCEAMAYAHSRGVLHRDLKPGNIMLGRYGETLIVDWGLAKVLGSDVTDKESTAEPKLTQPRTDETIMGQAVGTPAFMSPEQAVGRLDLLGPRSDVYGLGATLYCLLVGRRPFEGVPSEVLRKVERGDFPAPRRVSPRVPRGLEAICLKSMSVDPGQRYADPLALADDVEHWLADEPVSAWREPLTTRARRWIQRRQTWVATAAAATLVALVTSGVALSLVTTANRSLDRANDDLSKTIAKLEDSNTQLAEAVEREEKAKAAAQQQAQLADENFRKARRVVDEFFTDVSENPALLAGAPETQALRQRLLERAREYYSEVSQQHAGDAALKSELADTQFRLSELALSLLSQAQRAGYFQQAARIQSLRDDKVFAPLKGQPTFEAFLGGLKQDESE